MFILSPLRWLGRCPAPTALRVLRAGDKLDRLMIEGFLGEGGMGVVYKVRDVAGSIPYAAKVLNLQLRREGDFVKRFKTEARIASRLKHINVAHVHKFSRWQGTFYYTMEMVEGIPLEILLHPPQAQPPLRANDGGAVTAPADGDAEGGPARLAYNSHSNAGTEALHGEWETAAVQHGEPMTLRRALVIVREVAAGLTYVHSKGYVHRDIKPGNVLVRTDDHVKIIDFGLAQRVGRVALTRSGHVMGTAKYMAPELIRGERVYPQTDIYSLGVMLYEMLAGRPPFDSGDTDLIMDMHLYKRHKPLSDLVKGADRNLCLFIDKMLKKDPGHRVSSAQAVHSYIGFYLQNNWFADVRSNL